MPDKSPARVPRTTRSRAPAPPRPLLTASAGPRLPGKRAAERPTPAAHAGPQAGQIRRGSELTRNHEFLGQLCLPAAANAKSAARARFQASGCRRMARAPRQPLTRMASLCRSWRSEWADCLKWRPPGRVGLLLWVGMRDVSRQSRIVDKVIVCDRFMSICFMKATVVVSGSPVTFLRNNRRLPRQSGRSARATVREPRVCAACSHHEL